MLKNIIDGFLSNPAIRYLPYRFVPMALGQMEALRRAHNFRPRIWVLPEDLSVTIPARDQYQRDIAVAPGSYLWAVTAYQFDPTDLENPYNPIEPADLSIQLTDVGSGVSAASEFLPASLYWPGATPDTMPPLLSQPRLVLEPGLFSVQIANAAATAAVMQLVLYFEEPCDPRELEGDACR